MDIRAYSTDSSTEPEESASAGQAADVGVPKDVCMEKPYICVYDAYNFAGQV